MAIHCNAIIKVYCWHCNKAVMTVLMIGDLLVIEEAMFIDGILIKQS